MLTLSKSSTICYRSTLRYNQFKHSAKSSLWVPCCERVHGHGLTQDDSYPEVWTFRTQSLDDSYPRAERFAPNVFFFFFFFFFFNFYSLSGLFVPQTVRFIQPVDGWTIHSQCFLFLISILCLVFSYPKVEDLLAYLGLLVSYPFLFISHTWYGFFVPKFVMTRCPSTFRSIGSN